MYVLFNKGCLIDNVGWGDMMFVFAPELDEYQGIYLTFLFFPESRRFDL